ncbi:galactose-1-phosphate uridylyltransferase [bacterium]|nr:galactose-1-phosphate uridylyltransferase [bacterium]
MSQIRYDIFQDRWVILAPERHHRPHSYSDEIPPDSGTCPFCEGNETLTPPEVYAIRPPDTQPDSPGWEIRVIPNKFSAISPNNNQVPECSPDTLCLPGTGVHELIIETPEHSRKISQMPIARLEQILKVYQSRLTAIYSLPFIKYVQVFKNYARTGGASLSHPHTQLMGIPYIPAALRQELKASGQHYRKTSNCLFCNTIQTELQKDLRIPFQTPEFVVLMPFASRFPYECWILPREHHHDFLQTPPEKISRLAEILKKLFQNLEQILGNFPYNLILHSLNKNALPDKPVDRTYHWHFELLPRITHIGGFECATGSFINQALPEETCLKFKNLP